jgi:hypothetical protein
MDFFIQVAEAVEVVLVLYLIQQLTALVAEAVEVLAHLLLVNFMLH